MRRSFNIVEEYHMLQFESKMLKEELEEINGRAEYFAGAALGFGGSRSGHKVNAFDSYLLAKEKLEEKIIKHMYKLLEKRLQIDKLLDGIKDEESRRIAYLRLVKKKSWVEIGRVMYLSERTVQRRLKSVLEGAK
jgi:hypothetical protein